MTTDTIPRRCAAASLGPFDRRSQAAAESEWLAEHLPSVASSGCQASTARVRRQRQAWREDMMSYAWNQGSLVMLDHLADYLRVHRSGPKAEALRSLRGYVAKRVKMTDYPSFRQMGYDCGSGPTESFCGTLTLRLKGRGMHWDKDNAEAIMALGSLYYSNLWKTTGPSKGQPDRRQKIRSLT